jgi:hypothetical protein
LIHWFASKKRESIGGVFTSVLFCAYMCDVTCQTIPENKNERTYHCGWPYSQTTSIQLEIKASLCIVICACVQKLDVVARWVFFFKHDALCLRSLIEDTLARLVINKTASDTGHNVHTFCCWIESSTRIGSSSL